MRNNTIGLIGVGNMGRPFVGRLLEAGYSVIAFDPDPEAVKDIQSPRFRAAKSAQAVGDECETILLSLPSPAALQATIDGCNGLAQSKAARFIVDTSTIGPKAAMDAAERLRAQGRVYVDAPVSGGVAGARAGKLSVMAAAPKNAVQAVNPVLSLLGKIYYVGADAGMAQTMKLVNNLLSATALVISSEAMVVGVKAGLDPFVMLEIINASSGRNSATQDKFPKSVLTGSFDYGFGTGMSHKDVKLCAEEAQRLGVPMVVGTAVREILAITTAIHGVNSDYTNVCKVIEAWAGVEVRGQAASSASITVEQH